MTEPKGALVPERLKEQRQALGWTQAKLAQVMGHAHHSTISFWESGARVPNHKTVRLLAKAMGVSVAYLTGHADSPVKDEDPTGEVFQAHIPKRLAGLREAYGFTQKQVAEAVEVNASMIGHWEVGRERLSLSMLVRLARFYGCSTDYILGLTDDPLGSAAEDSLPLAALDVTQNPHFLRATADPVTRQILTRPDTYIILRALAAGIDLEPKTLEAAEHLMRTIREARSIPDTP